MEHGNRRVSRVSVDREIDLNAIYTMLTTHSAYQSLMFQYEELPGGAVEHGGGGGEGEEDRVEDEKLQRNNAKGRYGQ